MIAPTLRQLRYLSPGCSHLGLVAGIAAAAILSPLASSASSSASTAASSEASAAASSGGIHDLCGVDVLVSGSGQLRTSYDPPPSDEFSFVAGLWVGATADRGEGPVTTVSTAMYELEFWPPEPPAGNVSSRESVIRVTYTDVEDLPWIPASHVPLGLRVVQESVVDTDTHLAGAIGVKYRIENISHEYSPPGWPLEDVYVGVMMDPDIGRDPLNTPWSDDHAGFARSHTLGSTRPPGARNGDLAYAWDEPGDPSEDVNTQLGIVVRGAPAHRFAVWSSALDPFNDLTRYLRLRGDSHGEPTIDPPTTRANDQRVLVSIGPIPFVGPGESIGFSVDLVCGNLVPSPPWVARHIESARVDQEGSGLARVTASPNPVSLSTGSSRGVAFSNLPPQASVRVYSVDGRLVSRVEARGANTSWNLHSLDGAQVPGGVYFYQVSDPQLGSETGRLVLLR